VWHARRTLSDASAPPRLQVWVGKALIVTKGAAAAIKLVGEDGKVRTETVGCPL
jgi:hypothetical protein